MYSASSPQRSLRIITSAKTYLTGATSRGAFVIYMCNIYMTELFGAGLANQRQGKHSLFPGTERASAKAF
jgi:hypothetical protein